MAEYSSLLRKHQVWIGNLQPVGLLVSAPVLEALQVPIDLNPVDLHREFLSLLTRDRRGEIIAELPSFRDFGERILGWPATNWVAPAPEGATAFLETYREQIAPDAVLIDTHDNSVVLLISQVARGVGFDDVPEEKSRAWNVSPHARLERLLRESGHSIGILAGPHAVRLIYAPKRESTAYADFRIEHMATVQGRMLLGALYALLGYERLITGPVGERLPAILRRSRDYQNDVSNELAGQVLEALYALLRGFQAADDYSSGALLRETLEVDPSQVYNGLLTVLMRLVFLLYAEDRGLMPQENELYQEHYSVSRLYDQLSRDRDQFPTEMSRRYGAWARLLALFGLVWSGGRHGRLKIPARHGYLFDPSRYPFLGKKDANGELPHVPDGTVLEVLRKLLILEKERISYRALDVEQIGSVYEAIMGFELHRATGPSRALRSAKRHGPPVTINLETLLSKSADNRAKWLKTEAGVELSTENAKLLKAAKTLDDLEAALHSRIHEKVTPERVRKGAMILQPSLERRRTGSHYTPRSLTRPIVETTLEPLFAALGPNPTPEQVLSLKVCDPAMGSGAFLVEASRQLGARLVEAWRAPGRERPILPDDEDEALYAQRLVVQRCIYGVDKNRMAVDLAKLSLWLATLARDHAFTFVDHNLRHGDSLVGLNTRQIASVSWEEGQPHLWLESEIQGRLTSVARERTEIQRARDDQPYDNLKQRLDSADERLDLLRMIGDAVCAAWMLNESPKAKSNALSRLKHAVNRYLTGNDLEAGKEIDAEVQVMRKGAKPVIPFHWEIEFPEVFHAESSKPSKGFDAFVGNPPFAGKNTLAEGTVKAYPKWLQLIHEESHGNADLVAHFFRRVFNLLGTGGCFGLIATNTIGQGDTRSSGLRWIRKHDGTIYCARKRQQWPGEATVVVSIVHVCRGPHARIVSLNDKPVDVITAYLFHRGKDENPARLSQNRRKSFQGSTILSMGFTFDDKDKKKVASPLSRRDELIASNPRNAERIFEYLGGKEINGDPEQRPYRYVISFAGFPLRRADITPNWNDSTKEIRKTYLQAGIVPLDYAEPVAQDWPDLLNIVEERVKPAREKDNRENYRRFWWRFAERRPGLEDALSRISWAWAVSRVSGHVCIARIPANLVPAESTVVFTSESFAMFAVLQSSIHEIWVRMMTSTLEDRLRYAPTDCFETFPFPRNYESNAELEQIGREYYEYRAELMRKTGKGLTKTYNRFHDKYDAAADIEKLRALHDAMDRAVLDAYGWQNLRPVPQHEREFGDAPAAEANSEDTLPIAPRGKGKRGGKTKPKEKYRRRWTEDDRDEVLFLLLSLNEEYAKEAPAFAVAGDDDPLGSEEDEELEEPDDMEESEEDDEE